ncbi:TPA: mechanosensitive channel MscK [Klebsiella oxytoca]|uniref:mechanosensitive channel MscK n=1 Tax=Klebsiella oxytoca TaxID=571 RepID=UPI001B9F9E2D|nr:mechanosensitive channel MscK [Klebsiella oxytoca]MCW9663481.1 mechanosensitive channel MscK [Klebsiella oxytoca]HBC7879648.1 mechanosensitive channel MscK [Klebsiella oxytoca]HCL7585927.1 mechanosensitive channel MscK [Klebsiella oxytoca]HDS4909795.1 mechanosensitive channel MscK [Klebsiella oxytoca]HDZ8388981.1 mechanosensitive channel MscK [Klebsiella oxytoca]
MLHTIRWRNALSAVVLTLMLFIGCISVNSALAADLPERSEVQSQLTTLNKQKDLTPQDKLVQQDLIQTLETLDKIERIKSETTQLRQQVAQAPAKMNQAIDSLNALSGVPNDEATRKTLSTLSLRQLESRVSQTLDDLQNAQNDLATYNSQLVSLQTQPERVQNAMYSASQQLQQIRNRLNGTTTGEEALRPTQQNLLLAQQALLNAQIDQQRKSLEGNTVLQDTLQKQRDYITAYSNRLEHQLQLLQEAVNSKRLTLTEKTAQEAVSPDETARIQANPLVKQELDINHQLSERLISATETGNQLVQRNIKVKTWLDRALQSERDIKEQISVLKGSLLLSRILYQQQQTLPSAEELSDMTNRIADLRLEQFEVNQQRDALFQSDAYVAKLEEGHSSEVNPEVHDALLEIVDMRRELLDQFNKQLGNQLMMAINLQINQQQLMSVSTNLKAILTQQIFWVNSNRPMDWEWFKAFPEALKGQFKAMKITVNWEKAWPAVFIAFLAGLPLLLIAGLIRWRLNWLKAYQAKLASQVGQLRNDTQLHTPKAILIDLIRALPVVLVILAVGLILLTMQLNISDLLWAYSKKLALFWLVFGLCWKVLEKDGVAVSHFNMPSQLTSHWRRQIVRVSLALLPLNFWSVMSELSPLHLMDDVLGQFVIFLNLLLIAVLVLPMCRESWRDKESHSLRLITVTVLSIVPIALMVLTATGYFYTTLRLAGRWIETVYLVMLWNLLYQTVLRGLSVAARRIAWRRALARRQHLVKEGAEGAEPQEEPTIALEQVNQQTLRITMLVMIALFAVLFWAIWSDLITVFAYLDSITLWHYKGTEAGVSAVKSVTMGSLLFAIVASMVAWALIRNLPGLLEVLVLSRLNMRQGASYAITTILNYAIIVIGAMTVFGALGVSWDKLQWLAAALSVGLGFGLQEIFGNFVSGLIILFERPVRIGDTVTIGTFSGTVSKIRIRATTITDFDRKEVIIPNKAFVTERLINWSLSDTVTRVVIRLGVAYGSDLDKVKEVLLKAAHEHPKVMQEPAPSVFFTTFGASTLDHELRLYVRELRDRSYAVDELNRAIDRLCRENNIDIAFNQLEVHLRNEKGDEVTEVKRDKGDDATPAMS